MECRWPRTALCCGTGSPCKQGQEISSAAWAGLRTSLLTLQNPFSKGMPYFRLGVLRLTRSISNSSTNTWLVGKPSGSLQENATTLSIHAHGQVKFYVIGAKPMAAFYSGLR